MVVCDGGVRWHVAAVAVVCGGGVWWWCVVVVVVAAVVLVPTRHLPCQRGSPRRPPSSGHGTLPVQWRAWWWAAVCAMVGVRGMQKRMGSLLVMHMPILLNDC